MEKVKSGKEILLEFFSEIQQIEEIDSVLTKKLNDLYCQGKFTETSVKQILQSLRTIHGNKD
jgi:hypothetical protein